MNISINPVTLGLALVALCLVGMVLMFVLQLFGGVLHFIIGIVGGAAQIVTGEPTTCCGCLLALLGCGMCGLVAVFINSMLANCGTGAAMNFCSLFGR